MKKALSTLALLAAAVGLAVLIDRSPPSVVIRDAHAQYAQSSVIARHFSSTVAAGAVIQTPVYDLSNVNSCIIYADNSAGGSTRALNADCMADDGTTIVYRASASLTTTTRGAVLWGNSVSAAALPAVTTIVPGGTCKKMQFTLAAAGAAAGTLAVDCR
jgi:hypothetical protein